MLQDGTFSSAHYADAICRDGLSILVCVAAVNHVEC